MIRESGSSHAWRTSGSLAFWFLAVGILLSKARTASIAHDFYDAGCRLPVLSEASIQWSANDYWFSVCASGAALALIYGYIAAKQNEKSSIRKALSTINSVCLKTLICMLIFALSSMFVLPWGYLQHTSENATVATEQCRYAVK